MLHNHSQCRYIQKSRSPGINCCEQWQKSDQKGNNWWSRWWHFLARSLILFNPHLMTQIYILKWKFRFRFKYFWMNNLNRLNISTITLSNYLHKTFNIQNAFISSTDRHIVLNCWCNSANKRFAEIELMGKQNYNGISINPLSKSFV